MNFGSIHIQCTYVTAVFRNYFNFPLVVLLRAAQKSRGDITARGDVVYLYTCVRVWVCIYVHIHTHAHAARAMHNILRPQSSFTWYLAFPFLPFPLPALRPAFLRTLQQRCTVPMHICVTHAHMFVLSEHCARLVAVPCRCMQILSSNLVSARASVLRGRGNGEGWKVAEGGRRGGERGSRGRR